MSENVANNLASYDVINLKILEKEQFRLIDIKFSQFQKDQSVVKTKTFTNVFRN